MNEDIDNFYLNSTKDRIDDKNLLNFYSGVIDITTVLKL